jgi:hypothetical protein
MSRRRIHQHRRPAAIALRVEPSHGAAPRTVALLALLTAASLWLLAL